MINTKNPKARYQNLAFIKRLRQARNYKRTTRLIPQNRWQFFLTKIGLNSLLAKIIAISAVILLIYLIYIPNFLNVSQITIEGAVLYQKQSIASTANDYLTSKPLWPQRNLLLLSKKDLADYLIKKNRYVLKLKSIKKELPDSLVIYLEPRLNKFLLRTKQAAFVVSNDGIIIEKNDNSSTSTALSFTNLIAIRLDSDVDFQVNQKILNEDWLKKIVQIENKLTKEVQNEPVNFETKNLNGTDLTVIYIMPPNHKIFLDASLDLEQILTQYKLLWENLKIEQRQNLYYVDLRIKGKAYVCYKNTACAKDLILKDATTTPAATPIQ